MKGILGINLEITLTIDSLKNAYSINPAIMSVADFMKCISIVNIVNLSQIDSLLLDDSKINLTSPFSTKTLKGTTNNFALQAKFSNVENKISKKSTQKERLTLL